MLNSFRKSAKSPFAKIIYALIALSFVVWGVDVTAFSLGSSNHPAEVGDRPITVQQVDRAFQVQVSQLRQTFGNGFTTEQAIQFGMLDNTVQQLVSQAVLENAALDMGAGVDDETVRAAIFDDPTFQNQAGRFDRDRFTQILSMNRYTEGAYVEEVRSQLIRNQLIAALTQGVTAPSRLVDPIAAHRAEQRQGEYFVVSAENVPDIAEPTEDQLAAFHKDNPAAFTAPELRDITLVALTAAELAKNVEVTAEEIQAFYDEHQADYETEESRSLRQMLFLDDQEDLAKQAHQRLNAGEDFNVVAQELTGMSADFTSLGTLTRGETLDELREAAFGLAEGGVSAPVKSGFGWHILKAEKVTPANTKPLEKVQTDIADQLKLDRASEELFEITGNFEDQLGGGASLAQAAGEFGLTAVTATIDRAGNGVDGKPVDLPVADAIAAAFELEDGEEGQLTEFGQGDYFIVKVEKVTPSALKPLSDVKADVEAAWRSDARQKKAKEIAEGFAKQTGELSRLAEAGGYDLINTDLVTRDGAGGSTSLPSSIISSLFDLELKGRTTVSLNNGVAVVALEKIESGAVSSDRTAALSNEFRQSLASDLIGALNTSLAAETDVVINRSLLNDMYAHNEGR